MAQPTELAQPKKDVQDKAEVREQKPAFDSNDYQAGAVKDKPKSAEALAVQWNDAANQTGDKRFDKVNADLTTAFKDVYGKTAGDDKSKSAAVKAMEMKINETTEDGKGVLVQAKGDGKFTIRHVQRDDKGTPHPDYPDQKVKDQVPAKEVDLKQKSAETRLEQFKPGDKSKVANTEQYPSDPLMYKVMNANPEWAKQDWKSDSSAVNQLLKDSKDPKIKALADSLPKDMLDAAAGDPKMVNDFLQSKGMGRLLQERPGEEAAAAVMSIKGDWKASKATLQADGKDYAAFDRQAKVYNVGGKEVYELYKRDDGTTVYAIPNNGKLTGEQANNQAKDLIGKVNGMQPKEEGIIRAPMVDYDKQESLNWMVGTRAGDRQMSQVAMQTKIKMDENGFEAKQAIAIGMTRGFSLKPEPIRQITNDFTFVAAKDGIPLIAQPISKENWKDPKRQ
jgi:hypothetical protein